MGLVAVVASHAARMLDGCHLREAFRLGRVLLMAAAAQVSDVRQFRNMCRGIVRVLRLRTMARFAGYVGVLAAGSGLTFVLVAQNAGILPGERYGVLAYQVERARPVVAKLTESFGDDSASDEEENRQNGQNDEGRPNQMSGIAE